MKPRKTSINLNKKKIIAEEFRNNNITMTELAIRHNISYQGVRSAVKPTPLLENLSNEDSILLKDYMVQSPKDKYLDIDTYICEKINIIRNKGGNVNKCTIRELAKEFNTKKNGTYNISNYFINTFVKRNNLIFKTLHGESKVATINNSLAFVDDYKEILKEYDEKDIFNIDETGVFVKNLGNKSYVISRSDTKGIKIDKTRLTVMLGISRCNEKLPALVIGKSAKPRALKNINVQQKFKVFYDSNNKAWLTREIFKKYLDALNQKMLQDERKILILLDNFSGHVVGDFSNIKLIFLPPNSTSLIQPLDQGIIHSFKSKYKSFVINFINAKLCIENLMLKNAFLLLNMENILFWISEAYNNIDESTARNCWKKLDSFLSHPLVENSMDCQNIEIDLDADDCVKDNGSEELCIENILDDKNIEFKTNSLLHYINKIENVIELSSEESMTAFFKFKNHVIEDIAKKSKKYRELIE